MCSEFIPHEVERVHPFSPNDPGKNFKGTTHVYDKDVLGKTKTGPSGGKLENHVERWEAHSIDGGCH